MALKLARFVFWFGVSGVILSGIVAIMMNEHFFLGVFYSFVFGVPPVFVVSTTCAIIAFFKGRKSNDGGLVSNSIRVMIGNTILITGTLILVLLFHYTFTPNIGI